MRWQPAAGHIPRGWIGATSQSTSTVRLIIVAAEPGDPADGEQYDENLDARSMLAEAAEFGYSHLIDTTLLRGGRPAPYHRNLRSIISLCWPDFDLQEQLARTWITSAVLCSAPKSGGPVGAAIVRECVNRYLRPEIALMPDAYVLALGDKAANRLRSVGLIPNGQAQHPSARPNTKPEGSWRTAAAAFRDWLGDRA
jgi:hypothetical protein